MIQERNVCGLANDTKWDELIGAIRNRSPWRPSYRFKCVDGPASGWDVEWFYHLPFPMISVEWFDIYFLQDARDHSDWIEETVKLIGFDYRKGEKMIRIFGYSPRDMDLFDD